MTYINHVEEAYTVRSKSKIKTFLLSSAHRLYSSKIFIQCFTIRSSWKQAWIQQYRKFYKIIHFKNIRLYNMYGAQWKASHSGRMNCVKGQPSMREGENEEIWEYTHTYIRLKVWKFDFLECMSGPLDITQNLTTTHHIRPRSWWIGQWEGATCCKSSWLDRNKQWFFLIGQDIEFRVHVVWCGTVLHHFGRILRVLVDEH